MPKPTRIIAAVGEADHVKPWRQVQRVVCVEVASEHTPPKALQAEENAPSGLHKKTCARVTQTQNRRTYCAHISCSRSGGSSGVDVAIVV